MLGAGWPLGEPPGAIDGVDGDGGEAQFLRGFDHAGAAAALVFHLVAQFGDLGARALDRDLLFQIGGAARIGRLDAGLDLADLDQRDAEPALHRLADLAGRQREGGVRDRRIDNRRFRDRAEVDVGRGEPALLGQIVERHSGCDAAARRRGFFRVRKHDLRHLALLRRAKLVAALLEQLPWRPRRRLRTICRSLPALSRQRISCDIRARGTGPCDRRNSRPASPATAGRWFRPGRRRA